MSPSCPAHYIIRPYNTLSELDIEESLQHMLESLGLSIMTVRLSNISTGSNRSSSSVSRLGMESIRGGREKINHENCRAWLTSVLPKHSTQDFQKDKEKTEEQLFNDLKDGKLLCRLVQFFTKEEIAIKNRLISILNSSSGILCSQMAPLLYQSHRELSV